MTTVSTVVVMDSSAWATHSTMPQAAIVEASKMPPTKPGDLPQGLAVDATKTIVAPASRVMVGEKVMETSKSEVMLSKMQPVGGTKQPVPIVPASTIVNVATCTHGIPRNQCKECVTKGPSICEHGRRRTRCKDCGGSSICTHGRRSLLVNLREPRDKYTYSLRRGRFRV